MARGAPVRNCPSCGATKHVRVKVCDCGHVFVSKAAQKEAAPVATKASLRATGSESATTLPVRDEKLANRVSQLEASLNDKDKAIGKLQDAVEKLSQELRSIRVSATVEGVRELLTSQNRRITDYEMRVDQVEYRLANFGKAQPSNETYTSAPQSQLVQARIDRQTIANTEPIEMGAAPTLGSAEDHVKALIKMGIGNDV